MNKLLAKWFIKDHNNIKDCRVRNAYGTMSSIFGIICNTILSCAKIAIGALAGSMAIISDGINNLSDMSSSAISLVGFRMSNRPPDKKHPFGHARMEYISTLIVAFIIIFVGIQLTISSIESIMSGQKPAYSTLLFCILGSSILIKGYMAYFYMRNSRLIESKSLRAVAIDSINDVIATSAILICSLIGYFTKVSLDGYVSIVVSLYIMIAGIKLVKDTLSPLLGEKPAPELVDSLVSAIRAHKEILGIHDLMIHNYGQNKHFVTLHAEVDSKIDVMTSHELIDNIEKELTTRDMQCIIHMDPIVTDDPRIDELKGVVNAILQSIDSRLSLHDFRVITGPNRSNIIFDMVLPNMKDFDENELTAQIDTAVKLYDSSCNTVVNYDYNFM